MTNPKRLALWAALALTALAAATLRLPAATPERFSATLTAITDGDTVKLLIQGRQEKCRLIGIDAPELAQHPWGQGARAAMAKLLSGRALSVEIDVQERDRYGRLLIYLFANGTLVNETMILQGNAQLYTVPPNVRYVERFRRAQEQARAALRGIWAPGEGGLQDSPSEYRRQKRARP